ncbi:MAG: hypothetical protein M1827_003389 [Pycnora praestabilis]|nr:MAG: hypothetical protein M1827_003389 [Pycnora praestabilis]
MMCNDCWRRIIELEYQICTDRRVDGGTEVIAKLEDAIANIRLMMIEVERNQEILSEDQQSRGDLAKFWDLPETENLDLSEIEEGAQGESTVDMAQLHLLFSSMRLNHKANGALDAPNCRPGNIVDDRVDESEELRWLGENFQRCQISEEGFEVRDDREVLTQFLSLSTRLRSELEIWQLRQADGMQAFELLMCAIDGQAYAELCMLRRKVSDDASRWSCLEADIGIILDSSSLTATIARRGQEEATLIGQMRTLRELARGDVAHRRNLADQLDEMLRLVGSDNSSH